MTKFERVYKPMKMDLQFFNDGGDGDQGQGEGGDGSDGNGEGGQEGGEGDGDDDPTYSQSDVDSAVSKAVEKALRNRDEKHKKELEEAKEAAKKEAADYAKMTKDQQAQADYEKRLKELEKREKEINDRELLGHIKSDLQDEGLPESFAETLLHLSENEKIKDAITDIKKQFDDAVNDAVKKRLRQETPPGSGGGTDNKPSIAAMRNKQEKQKNQAPDPWAN